MALITPLNKTGTGLIPSLIQPGKTLVPSLIPPQAPRPATTAPAPLAVTPAPTTQAVAPPQTLQPSYDPVAAAQAAQAAADAAKKKAIMDASLAAIQKNIDSLGIRKDNTLAGVDTRYNDILARYGDQEAQNEAAFNRETEANQGTYSRNQSLALQSAATGRQSLLANLGAIGALGPTALRLANRAVAKSANADIGEANRTFESNATTLTEARDKTKQEEKNRRNEATAARESDRQSAEYDYLEALQKAYSDMAGTYAQGDDIAGATNFTGKAGGLFEQLARNTRPIATPYTPRDIALDTSKLSTYLAGQRSNSVSTKGDSPTALNSPLYSLVRRREELA